MTLISGKKDVDPNRQEGASERDRPECRRTEFRRHRVGRAVPVHCRRASAAEQQRRRRARRDKPHGSDRPVSALPWDCSLRQQRRAFSDSGRPITDPRPSIIVWRWLEIRSDVLAEDFALPQSSRVTSAPGK